MKERGAGKDEALRVELLRRAARDQKLRDPARFHRRWARRAPEGQRPIPVWLGLLTLWVDRRNTIWLARVVSKRGWPGIAEVGPEAANAAWLLAQHADRRPHAQRSFLEALREAVTRADADLKALAHLEDRVRVNAGRAQVYGTQYTVTEAGFGPHPIEDPDGLDDRRATAGLPPMAEYDAQLRGKLSN